MTDYVSKGKEAVMVYYALTELGIGERLDT